MPTVKAVSRAVLLAIALAGAAGCAPPPPPVLAHAETTAGLRIRISDQLDYLGNGEDEEKDEENRKAMAGAQHALVVRLVEAGYVVVDKGPFDVSASTWSPRLVTLAQKRGKSPAAPATAPGPAAPAAPVTPAPPTTNL
jgi:hypothetical protein